MANSIDTNVTSMAIAEETSLKVLPGTPDWYAVEPNSYGDIGSEITTVDRNPINPSRQKKKGGISDLDASFGFNMDLTQNNAQRLLQGFFFADAREKPTTKPLNAAQTVISGVTAVDDRYAAASGLGVFLTNHLVLASGFSVSTNNGLKNVLTSAAGYVGVSQAIADETPTSAAKLQAVGYQFPTGDVAMTIVGADAVITSATITMTTLGLNVGEWIFIGGDSAATKFTNNAVCYARIKAISAAAITVDAATIDLVADAGAAKTIQIFFGDVVRNEKETANIVRRSYCGERQLGEDGVGTQAQYIEGCVANELKISMPQQNKIEMDMSFVALDETVNTGTEGVRTGNRIPIAAEGCFNTTTDLYRTRIAVKDGTMNPDAVAAFLTEANVTIKNNASVNKALGVLGGFDISVGNFEAEIDTTAYFSTVALIEAVRANDDGWFYVIKAKENAGIVLDLPLLTLSNGKPTAEKDQKVKLPIKAMAAECENGYTALVTFLNYLPTAAMPA